MARTATKQNCIDVTSGWATELAKSKMTAKRRKQGALELKAVLAEMEKEWGQAPNPDQQNAINVVRGWATEMARPAMTAKRRKQGALELTSVVGVEDQQWPVDAQPAPPPDLPFTLVSPVDAGFNEDNPFGGNPPLYAPLGYAGHPGIDFLSPIGSDCRAAAEGDVLIAGNQGTAGMP